MAEQWYYAQQGQRQGPVSEEQLKQLAFSGRVKPTDLVWKQGMAAWTAASAVEGLIPKPSEPEPPLVPQQGSPLPLARSQHSPPISHSLKRDQSATAKVKGIAASLAKRGKAAAQFVAKQAERTKLVNMTLPAAYQALGKQIHIAGKYRDEFAETYKIIDDTLAQIAALQTHSADGPKATGVGEKVKAAAKATNDMAHVQALKPKVSHALVELGKAVFDKHGAESGPEEVVRPVLNCRARIVELDAEIKALSQSEPGQMITPKRIAIGGLCVASVVILLVIRGMFFGAAAQPSSRIVGTWIRGPHSLQFTPGGSVVEAENGREKVAKYSFTDNSLAIHVSVTPQIMAPKSRPGEAAPIVEPPKPHDEVTVIPVEFTSDDEMVLGKPDHGDAADLAGTWRRQKDEKGKTGNASHTKAASEGGEGSGVVNVNDSSPVHPTTADSQNQSGTDRETVKAQQLLEGCKIVDMKGHRPRGFQKAFLGKKKVEKFNSNATTQWVLVGTMRPVEHPKTWQLTQAIEMMDAFCSTVVAPSLHLSNSQYVWEFYLICGEGVCHVEPNCGAWYPDHPWLIHLQQGSFACVDAADISRVTNPQEKAALRFLKGENTE